EPLKALVISGQGGIDRALREAFAATGTSHILSISGLHVGMVAAFSYWAALFFFRRSEKALLAFNAKKAAVILAAVPAVVYALLAGLPVATQRSVIMALAFIASFAIGRGKDHLNTLSLAGLIILAISPGSIWDVSFQLSFAAMASIIILVPRLKEFLGKYLEVSSEEKEKGPGQAVLIFFRKRVLPLIFVTLAAGIGTSPILAYHFHRISLAGLGANLVAVPLAGVAVPSLLVSSALIPVSEVLAWIVLFPADVAFSFIARAVAFFAAIPHASLWVSPPALHEMVLYYLLVFSAVNIGRARVYIYAAPLSALLLFALPLAQDFSERPDVLRVTYLSVGQGDSAFVELPGGKTMLIDGGGTNNPDFDTGERVVAPFLRSKGVERIDYMVLSHAQQDHMGGLSFIARNMDVGEFWWNGEGSLGRLGAALEENKVVKKIVGSSTGKKAAGNAEVEFFNRSQDSFDTNDNSLVMKVSYGQRSFLFSGDISEKAEKAIASGAIEADVLKAPHHGSKYSSSAGFLSAVRPSVVVVSAGRLNSFGFPHAESLERYEAAGAAVMRTDTMGAVIIETDGKSLSRKGYLTGGEL
ncbi:partial ComE operon protein 3, partial [uncultured bacterium]